MFNVSALLLEDALKQAMPLTIGGVNENKIFKVKAYKKIMPSFWTIIIIIFIIFITGTDKLQLQLQYT